MRKMKLKERRRNVSKPLGKTGVTYNVDGGNRKTVKLSKDNKIDDSKLSSDYLGNDRDIEDEETDDEIG